MVGDRIWENLGPYSGFMCAGCAAGAFANAVKIVGATTFFDSNAPGISDRHKYELQASSYRHEAAFNFFYPLELFGVIFSMNLLLRRVSDHASHR